MSKSILLAKHHDITDFASKESSRYVLQSVHYSPKNKAVEATDGRVFLRVPVVESEEFPPVKGELATEPVEAIIPTAPLKRALSNVPKSNLPILAYAKLDINGKITLTTTDLETEQAVTCTPIDCTYPNSDSIMATPEPTFSVKVAANILKRIAEYALRHSSDSDQAITFHFVDNKSAIKFEIPIEDVNGHNKAVGVAMPVRMS